ncbi:unnamed protein product [Orchesella dallaii]|uniref:PDZ domain-containing protein n=1 Tax=Orchesella dallaii TaxID=48710 RepID=A0ABP1Q0L9_9HEXA
MCERRALLDAEMYKISEEDSQDEEVLSARGLAGYTEEVLKLGGPDPANNNKNGNNNYRWSYSIHQKLSTSSGPGGITINENYALDPHDYPQSMPQSSSTSSFSSAMHKFTSGSLSLSKYKILEGPPSLPTKLSFHSGGVRRSDSSHHQSSLGTIPDGDNLDWPETSTNSDSCLSSDDKVVNRSNKLGPPRESDKYLPRTYFGDHVKRLGEHEEPPNSRKNQNQNHNHNRNSYPRSRRRRQHSHHHNYHGRHRNGDSSSGSDSESVCSGGSSSPCADCVSSGQLKTTKRQSNQVASDNDHGHLNRRRHDTMTSSEGEDYEDESSYSDSSCGDDYRDYYDDEDEQEYFDDIVKFVSDSEVESNTNGSGDMFLFEYSAESDELSESSETEVRLASSSSASSSTRQQDAYHPHRQQHAHHHPSPGTNDSELGSEVVFGAPTDDPHHPSNLGVEQARNSCSSNMVSSGGISQDRRSMTGPSTSNNVMSSLAPSNAHFQKSGKGAKGKISRLLKRKRDIAVSKGENLSSPPVSVGTQENVGPETCSPLSSNFHQCHPPLPHSQCAHPHQQQQHQSPDQTRSNNSRAHQSQSKGASAPVSSSSSKQKGNVSTVPEKVFRFKDEHGGESRTVFVDIPQSRNSNLGRRATLIESILGIIPGRFSTPPLSSSSFHVHSNDRIMVAGFVPDGVASRYRRIKIGDCLESIDDIAVGHATVDQVLSTRSMYGKRRTAFETEYLRLKLTLRRVAGCMVSEPTTKNDPTKSSSARSNGATTGKQKAAVVSPHVQSNVALLFISTVSTTTAIAENEASSNNNGKPEKSKDVVYCWPKETDSKILKALAASQGMFSTLYRLLRDVTGSHPVVSKVVIDDCEMDVAYTSDDDGKSLLLMAVATCLSTFTIDQQSKMDKGGGSSGGSGGGGGGNSNGVNVEGKKREKKIRWREPQAGGVTVSTRVMSRLENLLKYQFGTLSRAFKETGGEKVARFMTNWISGLNDLSEDFLFLQVPGNFLRFPNCIRSGIDDVLYSFETSDALYTRDKSRRLKDFNEAPVFHCHGSCLMYKGFLVTSHLENELASSFHGWWRTQLGLWGLKRSTLHEKWKPASRLVLWQQTYIPRRNGGDSQSAPPLPSSSQQDLGVLGRSTRRRRGGRGKRGTAALGTSLRSEGEDEVGEHAASTTTTTPAIDDDDDEDDGNEDDEDNEGEEEPSAMSFAVGSISSGGRRVPCFSALVGIGNFTLGFVLEHLTDYQGHLRPDVGWIRRAMAAICRLYQSGLSRSFECWVNKQEREEFVELCPSAASSTSSSKHHRSGATGSHHQQEKSGGQSSSTSASKFASLPKNEKKTFFGWIKKSFILHTFSLHFF